MTDVNPNVDLEAMRRERSPAASVRPPRRRILRRLLPIGVLLGFGGVLLSTAEDLFRDPVSVTVVRPQPAATAGPTASEAFQASGWVEPEPFPQVVAPLTTGRVRELLVQEGDRVESGQVVARLYRQEVRIAVERTRAELALAEAKQAKATKRSQLLEQDYEANIELQKRLAVAEARYAEAGATVETRERGIARARVLVRVAEEELALRVHLQEQGAAGPREVERARAALEARRSELAEARSALEEARAAQEVEHAGLHGVQREQELRLRQKLELETARAEVQEARASAQVAREALELAELRLQRTEVRAPRDGVVLELLALPGTEIGLHTKDVAGVCSIYVPESLRIRVDVPENRLALVGAGQHARIRSQARPDHPYEGRVIRIVHRADPTKVTVEAHVQVQDPDHLLRPDMLCRVTFLAPAEGEQQDAGTRHVELPERVLVDGDRVWVVDPLEKVARLRAVVARRSREGWVLVTEGLNPTDKVVDGGREQLAPGTPVRIRNP